MQIRNRAIFVLYRFAVTFLASLGIWLEYMQLGTDMLRDFSSWFLIATASYFFISTIVTIFRRKQDPSHTFWPVFEGLLLISGMILFVGQIVFYTLDYAGLGLGILTMSLIYFALPIMVLIDWLFFSEKGRWRFSDPLYWLALPTIFVCWILASATMMPDTTRLRYPYDFLNWPEITIPSMFWQLVIIAVLIVIFSYICWLIDFIMSGNLSKSIVLPRIKTIVIEEDGVEDNEHTQELTRQPRINPKSSTKVKVEGLQDAKSAQNLHQSKPAKRIRVDDSKTNERLDAANEISRPKQSIRPEGNTNAKTISHNAKSIHSGPKASTRKSNIKDPEPPKSQSEDPLPKPVDSKKNKTDKKPAQKSKVAQKSTIKNNAKTDHESNITLNEPKIRIVEQIGEFKDDKLQKNKNKDSKKGKKQSDSGITEPNYKSEKSKTKTKISSDPV